MQNTNLQLDNFNGPLDLMLYLLTQSQINIKDIFLSQITEEYVRIVQSSRIINLEEMGDFLAMAARLLEIKSKALLPRNEEMVDLEEEKQLLITQLEEYKMIKAVLITIEDMQKHAQHFYTKLPEEYALPEQVVELREYSISAITNAIVHILERKLYRRQRTEHQTKLNEFKTEVISIKQSILNVLKMVSSKPMEFARLFDGYADKEHIVTYFIAILELLKLSKIIVHQNGIFSTISITKRTDDNE